MTSTPSPRGAARRAAIVEVASELFARHGYAAVGMDAIGTAAGVTGPAIYRHFPSKAALLAAVFDTIIDTVGTGPADATDLTGPGADAGTAANQLRHAIGAYARGVAAHRGQMAVFVREVHHLPDDESTRLRERQRTLVHRWRRLVAAVHPDWPTEQVRTAVHGTFGLLNAVGTFESPLDDAALTAHLLRQALASLEVPG